MRSASVEPIACLNGHGDLLVRRRRAPRLHDAEALEGLRQREGAVDEVTRLVRARVGNGQRGVTRGAEITVASWWPCTPSPTPGVKLPNAAGRAQRQGERRRARCPPTRRPPVGVAARGVGERLRAADDRQRERACLARSTDTSVPGRGPDRELAVAREDHQADPTAGRDDGVLRPQLEAESVERAGRDRVDHVVGVAVLGVDPTAREDRAAAGRRQARPGSRRTGSPSAC